MNNTESSSCKCHWTEDVSPLKTTLQGLKRQGANTEGCVRCDRVIYGV